VTRQRSSSNTRAAVLRSDSTVIAASDPTIVAGCFPDPTRTPHSKDTGSRSTRGTFWRCSGRSAVGDGDHLHDYFTRTPCPSAVVLSRRVRTADCAELCGRQPRQQIIRRARLVAGCSRLSGKIILAHGLRDEPHRHFPVLHADVRADPSPFVLPDILKPAP